MMEPKERSAVSLGVVSRNKINLLKSHSNRAQTHRAELFCFAIVIFADFSRATNTTTTKWWNMQYQLKAFIYLCSIDFASTHTQFAWTFFVLFGSVLFFQSSLLRWPLSRGIKKRWKHHIIDEIDFGLLWLHSICQLNRFKRWRLSCLANQIWFDISSFCRYSSNR